MPITILSPYSGKSIKVRDQDVGRAIRDEEGRIFYIVEGSDGAGQYASMTRKGSEKDEQRYRKLVDGSAVLDQRAKVNVEHIHDATGKKRSNPLGMLLLIVVLLALSGAAYVYFVRPDLVPWLKQAQPTPALPGGGGVPADVPGNTDPTHADPAQGEPSGDPVSIRLEWEHDVAGWRVGTMPAVHLLASASESVSEPVVLPVWEPTLTARDDETDEPAADPLAGFRVMASGLRYRVIEAGDRAGQRAQAGHYVSVRYAAYAMDGQSLIDDAQHTFILAAGQAIRAMDEGLAGVRPGGQRLLFVPKGHSVFGVLPGIERLPTDSFVLDVQLLSVRPGVSVLVEEAGEEEAEPAMPGDRVALEYTATVEGEPEPFDSSHQRGRLLSVTLGQGEVIPGLAFGLAGIKVGETRVLTIPPYLAYGEQGAMDGLVPSQAVLTYRVTVVLVERMEEAEEDAGE